MTPVTWGLTHSGLGSLSRTDFLPVRHTETLCVSCSARRHRPVPWPHVRPGWAASCAVSPSHGLTPFRPPPPHTRLPRAAAALRRRRPVPHPSWCRSKFPGQRASPELADSSNRKSRRCFPTAHARPGVAAAGRAGPGAGDSETGGGRCAEDAGTGRGGGGRRARAAASAAPVNFLRDAGRQGAPLESASFWLHRGYLTPGWGSVRLPYLPARGSSSSPAPGLTRRRGPAPRAHGRPRRLRAF